MTDSTVLTIANRHGNVDVQCGVPKGYTHVPGNRLQPLCRKLGIKYAGALVGWNGSRRFPRPHVDGVIVTSKSAKRLTQAIQARQARSPTPEQKALAKQRRQKRDIDSFAGEILSTFPGCSADEANRIATHACEIGSGRVGRSSTADDPVYAAVVAHIRHKYTDYDLRLTESIKCHGYRLDHQELADIRADVREAVRPQIDEVLNRWAQQEGGRHE